ncbi:MAG TPA: hypothetical protein VN783_06415 [Thermoanaerobaculia bacterium]|nr:hypothetical protein [Thermoanaerobaculia bacterium]
MTVEVSARVERDLQDLADRQGREIGSLVEEALRAYLEAFAITDLTPAEVAATQLALVGDLQGIEEWKDGGE